MARRDVLVLFTMDCEPARDDVSSHALRMSASGPRDYAESAASIDAYCRGLMSRGFPVTLFLHPEVAEAHADLVLALEADGACLGLHLHPYKLGDGRWRLDLGAYPADVQREILRQAVETWQRALGRRPLYFRAGYFSANDATFAVLEELGFRGGSLSIPGRVLPEHFSVWAGADPYPHRADLAFRQNAGTGDFVEVPVPVDRRRPVTRGHAGEAGFEWPYIPASAYDHRCVVTDMLEAFADSDRPWGTVVMDTHNDQDYGDPAHPATRNLAVISAALRAGCDRLGLRPLGGTVADVCDRVPTRSPRSRDGRSV